MKSYSQNNEQEHILNYFGDYVGTFADLGSNDGITFSNVRALVEHGWTGIFVEPSPIAFDRLKENYAGLKGLYFYPFALGGHNGRVILNESGALVSQDDVSLVSTIKPAEMKRFKKSVKYSPITVDVYRWKTALNRWYIKTFDFISLDIEGAEMDVLPEIDLTETKCICLEWNGKEALKQEYEKYLSGFKLIYASPENLIYGR